MTFRRLSPLLLALTSLAGCSFAFVHGPPPNHEKLSYFDCSSSNILPVLDALYAGVAVADTVAASVRAESPSSPASAKAEAAAFAAEAALVGASAIYGFTKTSECRKAQGLLLNRAAAGADMPTFAPAPRVPAAPIDPWTGRPAAPWTGPAGPPSD